jgi:hypothetical protein
MQKYRQFWERKLVTTSHANKVRERRKNKIKLNGMETRTRTNIMKQRPQQLVVFHCFSLSSVCGK